MSNELNPNLGRKIKGNKSSLAHSVFLISRKIYAASAFHLPLREQKSISSFSFVRIMMEIRRGSEGSLRKSFSWNCGKRAWIYWCFFFLGWAFCSFTHFLDRLYNLSPDDSQSSMLCCSLFQLWTKEEGNFLWYTRPTHTHSRFAIPKIKGSSIAFSLTRVNKFLSFLLFSPIWNEFWMSTKENSSSIFGKFSKGSQTPRSRLFRCICARNNSKPQSRRAEKLSIKVCLLLFRMLRRQKSGARGEIMERKRTLMAITTNCLCAFYHHQPAIQRVYRRGNV